MRMASTGSALLLGVAGIASAALGGDVGCSPSKPTEIVPGALTQVRVPKDLAGIQVEVKANGERKFCIGYTVDSAGIVLLPSTLGVIAGSANTQVQIAIRGYDDANNQDLQNCTELPVDDPGNPNSPGPGARVLRRATLTYVNQHTLFLPMTLSFSCYDNTSCTDSQTCKGGQCVDDTIDPATLPDYDPTLVDGTQLCFSPSTCFAPGATADATLVDASTCTYAVPQVPGAPAATSNLNVRIAYAQNQWAQDTGTGTYVQQAGEPFEQEILSQDDSEGFTLATGTPGQFTLAKGLCDLVKAGAAGGGPKAPSTGTLKYPVISNVQVALGCPAKQLLLPFCAGEQNTNVNDNPPPVACGVAVPLTSSPSAVYVVVDNSQSMHGAFGPTGYATAMNLSFADPVFKKTYIAFDFLKHDPTECSGTTPTSFGTPSVTDWGLPATVQPTIGPVLLNPTYPDSKPNYLPLDLGAALRLDQGAYKHVQDFIAKISATTKVQNPLNEPSVMVFVNRIPVAPGGGGDAGAGDGGGPDLNSADDCPLSGATSVEASLVNQVAAAAQAGFHTYFVVLDNDQHNGPSNGGTSTVDFFTQVKTDVAGKTGSTAGVDVIDATSTDKQTVFTSFQTAIGNAVTCVYDQPAGIDATASLSVVIPPNTPGFPPSSSPLVQGIPPSSACKLNNRLSGGGGDGWAVDSGHVVVCGNPCQEIQLAIGQSTLAALQKAGALTDAGVLDFDGGSVAVPEVPVTATVPCK